MTIQQKIIKNKVGLLGLAEELGNVSKACKIMVFSRDTFYRYKELMDDGGIENLSDRSRKKPNLKNRVDELVEAAVVTMAFKYPAYEQTRASNELRKRGTFISPAGTRSIWIRHNLETFKNAYLHLKRNQRKKG